MVLIAMERRIGLVSTPAEKTFSLEEAQVVLAEAETRLDVVTCGVVCIIRLVG